MACSLCQQERRRCEREEKSGTTEIIPCRTVPDGHLKTSSGGRAGPTRPRGFPGPLSQAVRLIPPPPPTLPAQEGRLLW